MPRFYVDPSEIGTERIVLSGGNYNHVKNVLRKQVGDTLLICDGQGSEFDCEIISEEAGTIVLRIADRRQSTSELPVSVVLFQGIPKKDKMEWIIEKSVELGASAVIPVSCMRSVVKFNDDKREEKKTVRWNAIAEAAAKQSGRGIVPEVASPMSFREAMLFAKETCDGILFPYENAEGMHELKIAADGIANGQKIAVFIGPEGGFDPEEVAFAESCGAKIISLGSRILRTETAGLAVLSYLMLRIEMAEGNA